MLPIHFILWLTTVIVPLPQATIVVGPDQIASVQVVGAVGDARVADDDVEDTNIQTGGPWVGVQFGPVSRPLASHLNLGESTGQMVLNVVKDSPADSAGLKQFDVIVRFDDQEVPGDIEAFLDSVRAFSPGETHTITYFHEGIRTEATVVIGTRPESPGEYKYEVESPGTVRDQVFDRLHLFEKSDQGNWKWRKLDWKDLPSLQLHLGELGNLNLGDLNITMDLDTLGDGFNQHMYSFGATQGRSIQIERDSDGHVTVTTTEKKDGKTETTTKTYDGEEELKRDDPEAYKLYQNGGPGMAFSFGQEGFPKGFGFQFDVDGSFLKDLNERLGESREAIKRFRERVRSGSGRFRSHPSSDTPPRTSFEVTANGQVRVTIRQAGEELVQTFEDEQALKDAKPELYERFNKLKDGSATD
ncbi:MAG: S1C family serine protease [Phycisphaerae bacterium]